MAALPLRKFAYFQFYYHSHLPTVARQVLDLRKSAILLSIIPLSPTMAALPLRKFTYFQFYYHSHLPTVARQVLDLRKSAILLSIIPLSPTMAALPLRKFAYFNFIITLTYPQSRGKCSTFVSPRF